MDLESPRTTHSDLTANSTGIFFGSFAKCVALMQGLVIFLNINCLFMMACAVHTVLLVDPFPGIICLLINVFSSVSCVVVFIINTLMPFVTFGSYVCQCIGCVCLILVITLTSGDTGKMLYLTTNGVLGLIFGVNILTSHSLIAYGPTKNMGFYTFGTLLGGVLSFLSSIVFKTMIFPENSTFDMKKFMVAIFAIVCLFSFLNAVILFVFISRKSVKEHYIMTKMRGTGRVRYAFGVVVSGIRYGWKLFLIYGISYMNVFAFYPSIAPGSWQSSTVGEKVIFVVVVQLCMTIGRAFTIYIRPEYAISNVNHMLILVVANMLPGIYFFLVALYQNVYLITSYPLKTIVLVSWALSNGYSVAFCEHNIESDYKEDTHSRESITAFFIVCMPLFSSVGCAFSQLMLYYLV